MSENQKQNIIDVHNIMCKLNNVEAEVIKELAEKMIDAKLLTLVPDAILENMDVTEKLMMIDLYSMSEEERERARAEVEAIPLDEILKEEGLKLNNMNI